jgi:hypothetical protein
MSSMENWVHYVVFCYFAMYLIVKLLPPGEVELDPIKIIDAGAAITKHSWEIGTYSQALLEFFNPEVTVFGTDPFPEGKLPPLKFDVPEGLRYAQPFIETESHHLLIDGGGESISELSSMGSFIKTMLLANLH